MKRVVPITPVTEDGSVVIYGDPLGVRLGIMPRRRVVPISRVTFNEDGSVSLPEYPQTRHYALEVRPYFSKMVEGTLKQMDIEFEREIVDTGHEQLITYRTIDVDLPEIKVSQDGEATTMTGRLYETIRYGDNSIRFQDIVTSKRRRQVVRDFRRFVAEHF